MSSPSPVLVQPIILQPESQYTNQVLPIATVVSPAAINQPNIARIPFPAAINQPPVSRIPFQSSNATVYPANLVTGTLIQPQYNQHQIIDTEALAQMRELQRRKQKQKQTILSIFGILCFVLFVLPSTLPTGSGDEPASHTNTTRDRAGPSGSGCFLRDTKVIMENGSIKYIQDIELNDTVQEGGRVTSVYKFLYQEQRLFNVSGLVVTGSHKMKENEKWIYVKNSKKAHEFPNMNVTVLFNLDTELHRLVMKDAPLLILADFTEVNDVSDRIGELELEMLNSDL